jgi:hypothetical protein
MSGGNRVLAAWAALFFSTAPVWAQAPTRTPVVVDYVGVEGVYIAIGTEDGLAAGDTLDVFAGLEANLPTGRLVLVSVTRRRSVARSVVPGFEATAGEVIYLDLGVVAARPEPTPPQRQRPSAPEAGVPATAPRPSSISGRLSLDVDLRETRTSWTGELFGDTRRRFATPTTRLSMTARDLPGGLEIRTSLRASYRYADQPFAAPATSVRAYELSVVKRFDEAPLELRLGRFRNPYEGFGSYWDGALVRVGRRMGPGIGLVAGFEPNRSNEGFSSEIPKVAGFADFAARGRGWRYDTDVSMHLSRPDGFAKRRHVGWNQRFTLGRLSLSHRLRYDATADTIGWHLSELRIRSGLRLGGPVRLRGTYDRARPGALAPFGSPGSSVREEASAGVALFGNVGSMGLDVGSMRWGDDEWGRSIAGSVSARARGALISVATRYWTRSESRSVSVHPSVGFALGAVRLRLGYGRYDTESLGRALATHSADVQASTEVGRTVSVRVRAQRQWGEQLRGTRIALGLWRSF